MAAREPVEVTVEIDGGERDAGTLWVHERGGQTASFRYAESYLTASGSYALDPVLPVQANWPAAYRAFTESRITRRHASV